MLKRFLKSPVLIFTAAIGSAAFFSACSSDPPSEDDDGGSGGSSGGSGAMGGTGNSGTCSPTANVPLAIDPSGWMDMTTPCNTDVGVQGSWYPYGDQYGDGEGDSKCTKFGGHMPSECAQITLPPPPPAMGFTNVDGAMHTEGTVEALLPCVPGSMATTLMTSGCPDHDYSNMWGAGIGFDLNADTGETGGAKHTYDPAAHGVVGIRFMIDTVPLPGLRVEFPMLLQDADGAKDTPISLPPGSTTDSHSAGAPYWGAQKNGDAKYPPSPVMAGVMNTVLFDSDVQPPRLAAYAWEKNRMLGVQFHVPVSATAGTYSFTISKFELIRDPGQP